VLNCLTRFSVSIPSGNINQSSKLFVSQFLRFGKFLMRFGKFLDHSFCMFLCICQSAKSILKARESLLVLRESLLVLRETLLVLRESLLVLRETLLVLRESLLVLCESLLVLCEPIFVLNLSINDHINLFVLITPRPETRAGHQHRDSFQTIKSLLAGH